MADRQKASWVSSQVENTTSTPRQKTSWVSSQVENTSSTPRQIASWVAAQVEYSGASGLFTYDSGGAGSLPGGLDPDYTSVATWEADTDVDLQVYEGDVTLDCYDSQTHLIADQVYLTGATNTYWLQKRVLRSSPNCAIPFAGRVGTGANFCFSSGLNTNFYLYEAYSILEYFCVTSDPANSSEHKYMVYNYAHGLVASVVCGVVVHDIANSGSGGGVGIGCYHNVILNHCIVYGCKTQGLQIDCYFGYSATVHCTSCDNGTYGILHTSFTNYPSAWGNYCGGNAGGDFYEDALPTYSGWNASSDATADLGGDAGDNYKNSYDLLDGNLDADYLPTSPTGLSAAGGAGDNFGRNPYNDLTAYSDFGNYLKNDYDGMPESKKDIRGNDRPSGEVADASWAIGAAEYQEGEEPPVSGETAMPFISLF